MRIKSYSSPEQLEAEFNNILPVAQRFCRELVGELEILLEKQNIYLGMPIECRVKSWKSISTKLDRLSLRLKTLNDLQDLIGLRLILLFKRDISTVCDLISETFTVIKKEDTQERLKDDQFGYSSIHFVIKLPSSWLAVPSLSALGEMRAEIQVRTVSQHIWAASSHALQYKQEQSVPPPVRRAIHRVSALLETVDLEFERVLEQREKYRETVNITTTSEMLNVDLLEKVLDRHFPAINKHSNEDFSDLLDDLFEFKINTVEKLVLIIETNLKKIQEQEKEEVEDDENERTIRDDERVQRGVFYTHAGLARVAMGTEFGDQWDNYMVKKITENDSYPDSTDEPDFQAELN